jgi:hypothetical protein
MLKLREKQKQELDKDKDDSANHGLDAEQKKNALSRFSKK